MEGTFFPAEAFGSIVGFVGGLILLAFAVGAVLLGYIAHEEAKGRRIAWIEEPLAMIDESRQTQELKVPKAA